jgi:phosphatidate cytidylyltransferase
VLRQRTISAIVLVPPILIALALGQPWITIVIVLATAVAGWEVFALLASAGYASLSWLGIAIAIAVVLDGAATESLDSSGLLILAAGSILAAVGSFARRDPRDGLPTWFGTVFGAFYVALLSFVLRLGQAAPEVPPGAALAGLGGERGWILLLVLTVWAYDTGAYFAGSRFGRERFLQHISPSKTYAGLVGGIVAATVVAGMMAVGLGEPPLQAVILGPLIGLTAQAGDLAESMLKRAAGAKDSSRLIPGHGGILDRIDSFLFAAPALTLYVLAAVR